MINYVAAKGALVSANDVAPYLQLSEVTNRYTNGGPCVGLLEDRLRGLLEIDDDRAVVATCSGTAALHATIGALWLVRGCFPVAVQAFTFPCAVQQLLSGSCVVDVDPGGGLDLSQVPDHVGGIVVTNSFGHLLDLDRYEAWRRETGKVLVLDNASTPATYWRGRNSLNMGETIAAGDVELPANVNLVGDPAAVVVACNEPQVELDEEEGEGAEGAEPEVIGRKAEEEGESKEA